MNMNLTLFIESESEIPQSCETLCDPMDCSLPGSSIHGIFQARVLEWGARDQTRAPCTGSLGAQSQPLDHQGSPMLLLSHFSHV